MKNLITTIALFVMSVFVSQAQVVTMKVDTAQLFEYSAELGFERAVKEQNFDYKGSRYYSEKGCNWTINLSMGYVKFFEDNHEIVRYEGDKIVYQTSIGAFKIFMMTNAEDGRDMVFWLEPEKEGKVRGGFAYPKNVVTTAGQ